MTKIQILTDSGAAFPNARTLQQYAVTIVPNKLNIDGRIYRDGIDLTADETMKLIATRQQFVRLIPPTTEEYLAAYSRLSHNEGKIISIHSSREISQSWHNARMAARQIADTCEVAVIDSQTLCVGQGMLVRLACQTAAENDDFEEVVQIVRGAVERIFSVYYVESPLFLQQNGLMSSSRGILLSMMGLKPFLTIEEGRLMVTEKVRHRSQAIERMVEFLTEFEELEDAAIIQNRQNITEQTRILQDRLSVDFPGRHFPYTLYGSSLASLIGAEATGIVVLEKKSEFDDDDF